MQSDLFFMKTFFTWVWACVCPAMALATLPSPANWSSEAPTGYWLELETVTSHSGGILEGQTTYRLYLNTVNATDYLSSCSGDESNPMVMESSTGSWYNSEYNSSWNASGINLAFLGLFPELAFDSFLTIGGEDSSTPASEHPSAVSGALDFTAEFETGGGSNFILNDGVGGAWYTPFPGIDQADTHVAFAGDDLRVLVAQFTTAGVMSGQVQVQVFIEGNQADEFRDSLPFCTGDGECGGCTDAMASNYDPEAL